MRHIQTDNLFALVDATYPRRIEEIQIPSRPELGRLTRLETVALVASMRVVRARRVFEVCALRGTTTLNLALNIPPDGSVLTLELNPDSATQANQHHYVGLLSEIHMKTDGMDFVDGEVFDKITALRGNSTSFEFGSWKNSMDLVFIQGCDDFEATNSVTENAFSMIVKDKPTCVLWHNYRNASHSNFSAYLQKTSQEFPVFHIEDTNLWVHFNDPQQKIQARLQRKGNGMPLAA